MFRSLVQRPRSIRAAHERGVAVRARRLAATMTNIFSNPDDPPAPQKPPAHRRHKTAVQNPKAEIISDTRPRRTSARVFIRWTILLVKRAVVGFQTLEIEIFVIILFNRSCWTVNFCKYYVIVSIFLSPSSSSSVVIDLCVILLNTVASTAVANVLRRIPSDSGHAVRGVDLPA